MATAHQTTAEAAARGGIETIPRPDFLVLVAKPMYWLPAATG